MNNFDARSLKGGEQFKLDFSMVDLWTYIISLKLDCMMSRHAMVDDLSKNTERTKV